VLLLGQGVPPDSLRRALADVFAQPQYRWATGRGLAQWLLEQIARLFNWLAQARQGHPALFHALLIVLIVALLGILVHMGYVVWRVTRPTMRTPGTPGGAGGLALEDARVHRERADQFAAAGRYTEALAHRFVALVLELDRRSALQFRPSKTPAEYVQEARLDGSGRASLDHLVSRLYAHVFGAISCDAAGYREFATEADLVFDHVAAT
jgi:Domain of unknown function (DUF4129)